MHEEYLFLPGGDKLIKFYELVTVRISRIAHIIFSVVVIYKLQFLSQELFTYVVFLLLIRCPMIIGFFLISKISSPCNYLCKGYSTRLEHLNTNNFYNKNKPANISNAFLNVLHSSSSARHTFKKKKIIILKWLWQHGDKVLKIANYKDIYYPCIIVTNGSLKWKRDWNEFTYAV